ncbi:triacylglycerol lipase OBL1-like isoform X1 [Malania oleifera]|uniref:triacylglycerol lipase OBL1-like isoform X1 n=1 Tax=Malania oleifera TaxID=397392 RepID=UPI0025AE8AAC|nr:triacylglycerol lipase OBL1-like isoform X1 [Malania oleifera]
MAAEVESTAFASNYMLLKPHEVGGKGLLRILFSDKTEKKRKYVETPKEENLSMVDGWFLFISICVQKLLLLMAMPMALMGDLLTMWLNLLTHNGGRVSSLLLNILRGKMVKPNKSSATYLSIVAHLDSRVDRDPDIKHGDPRYYEALSFLAAKIAYENDAYIKHVVEDLWKMELLGAYNFWNSYDGKSSTQGFVMREKKGDSEIIIVSFRGTEPFNADDWHNNADLSWFRLPGVGKMHAGFMKAMGLQKKRGWPKEIEDDGSTPPTAYYHIRGMLRELLRANDKAKLIVTGHSLGGALAIVFPSILALHDESWMLERLERVYTYGQPRVGDREFGEFVSKRFREHGVRYVRFVYSNDLVPRIPYDDSGHLFRHFGTCVFYNCLYSGDIVVEEPFMNYLSLFGIIPMSVIAFWEIVRGFIYPYTKGPIYREGWLLFSVRLFGLIMPGISAHIPQDYNNATRLGSLAAHLHDLAEKERKAGKERTVEKERKQ